MEHTSIALSGVKSALRVLDVFELLVQHPDGLALSQICTALDVPKSSAHALLRTLVSRGYLRVGRRERTYRLGPALFEIGSAYLSSTDLVSDGQVIVSEIARTCDETVHLAVLDGSDVLYLVKEEGTRTVRMVSAVGKRFPAYGTGVGKVLLSFLSDDDLAQRFPTGANLPALTPRTITDPQTLRAELATIRARGYAFDHEESTPGLCCVAAPVYGATGGVVAGVSVSVPNVRFSPGRRDELLALVLAQTQRLSMILGFTGQPAQAASMARSSAGSLAPELNA
ncbi:MAG TPA: IclR family transcriptional regulator [Anaerolineales bacterium]|nr:IclR family transcriptional regulator [Anaerolineales bacterium]